MFFYYDRLKPVTLAERKTQALTLFPFCHLSIKKGQRTRLLSKTKCWTAGYISSYFVFSGNISEGMRSVLCCAQLDSCSYQQPLLQTALPSWTFRFLKHILHVFLDIFLFMFFGYSLRAYRLLLHGQAWKERLVSPNASDWMIIICIALKCYFANKCHPSVS